MPLGIQSITYPIGVVKQGKLASATWATAFSTTNAAPQDVTNGTVTISGLTAAKTYNILASVSSYCQDTTNQQQMYLVIGASVVAKTVSQTLLRTPFSLTGGLASQTGATSYTAKLQVSSSGGSTANINDGPDNPGGAITIQILEA